MPNIQISVTIGNTTELIIIPENKIAEAQIGFQAIDPKPNGISWANHLTDLIKRLLIQRYKKGKNVLALETITIESIFEN